MEEWTTHTAGAIRLEAPASWVRRDRAGEAELVVHERPREDVDFATNVNIVRMDSLGELTVHDFTAIEVARLEDALTEFHLLDAEPIETPEGSAGRVLATYRQGHHSLTLEQHYLLRNDHAFVVTATAETDAYDALADGIARILNSFSTSAA